MKNKLILFALLMVSVLALAACKKDTSFIQDAKLENLTLTVSIGNADGSNSSYIIKKDGYNYSYYNGSTTVYYEDYGSTTYLVTLADGVTTKTSSDEDLSMYFDAIKSLSLDELVAGENNSYTFKDMADAESLSCFFDGVNLDERSVLQEAYEADLIELTSATVYAKDGEFRLMNAYAKYNGESVGVTVSASNNGTTEVNMPEEDASGLVYADYVSDDNAEITLEFDGYGTVTFELFDQDDDTVDNVANYFVYLFKKGLYANAYCEALESDYVEFGAKKAPEKTVEAPSSSAISNERGTVAMMLLDDDDANTESLIINLADNSSDNDSAYIVIGGVTSGFDVLDNLSQLTVDDVTSISVKVSVKYNGYKYAKPTLE